MPTAELPIAPPCRTAETVETATGAAVHRALASLSRELPERRRLPIEAQLPDGSRPARTYCRTGRAPLHFGSPHPTTLFALRARHPEPPQVPEQERGR
ncbi:hypothetical protein CFP65_6172 [Kitasatospora sp. MMS16-BH015]|uniref:hypothetical protein n=1 Tax=Kitasatospora sp. MMS16-BH015 TaxID=2018025 RepID=UPI000CA2B22B|nr:hypothetical protein [Kitasatospora sp. MMS16-BH015]AUG80839.1 hypothetical protein CFP65_6172 [Kitasatospora sp. MMS16-BH015]